MRKQPSLRSIFRSKSDRKSRGALSESLESRTLFSVNPSVVDLLIAYTPAALNYVGSADKMVNKLRRAVADTDAALVNSQINASYRIVGIMEAGYTGDAAGIASISVLTAVGNAGQGFDDVRAMSTQVGADVVMVVANTNNGGVTDASAGYSIVYPKAINQDIVSHELGHALGGGHTRAADGVPTGNGVAWDSNVSIGGVSLGEGISGRDIDYYSNPNVLFRGVPTGVADNLPNAADNASAMNQFAPTAAARQASVTPVTSGPLAGLGPITNLTGQNSINFKVIYYDGAGVDVTTLGNNNINVTGPNSFSGTATFTGIDTQQNTGAVAVNANTWNSPEVIADYSIAVPSVGDLSTYSFALGSSPAKNIGGVAASGPLLDASGDAVVANVAQPPLLPQYGGGDATTLTPGTSRAIGLAGELGNVSGKSLVLNDYAGGYFANNGQGTALYHFTLANPGAVNFNTGTVLSSDTRTTYTSGTSLAAGDYYLEVGGNGPFTLKFSATSITSATGTISGFGYGDDNRNGVFDSASEYWTTENISLTGTDINGNPVKLSTDSISLDTYGGFTFSNVPVSNAAGYTLTWTSQLPNFYVPGAGSIAGGGPGMAQGSGTITGITLTQGNLSLSGYNLALVRPPSAASISGTLSNDANSNGVVDSGEAALVGLPVTLTGTDISGKPVSLSTTSSATGFTFSGVAASNSAGYTITVPSTAPGVIPGAFVAGTGGGTVNAASSISGIQLNGSNLTGYTFLYVPAPGSMTTPISPPTDTTVQQGGTTSGNVLTNATAVSTLFDYSAGFNNATLSTNGSSNVGNNLLVVLPNISGTGSAYYSNSVDVTKFESQFSFVTTPADPGTGDGMTFVIQNNGPTALGGGGGGLGYQDMGKSVAIKFDLYDNSGEGPSSTGLYTNGAAPGSVNSVDLRPSGIDLHSGDIMQVNMAYDGKNLIVTIVDTYTGAANMQSYPVNIPGIIGGNKAYVGFTGGSGGATSQQVVTAWTFSNTQGTGSTPAPQATPSSVAFKETPAKSSKKNPGNAGLGAALESAPSHAANFSFSENGDFSYTPLPGFVGTDTFTFACVNTATHRCSNDMTTVTIHVKKSDQAPTANNEISATATTAQGQALEVDLRSYVTDSDTTGRLHFSKIKGANGTAHLLGDGHTVLFKPAAGYTGPASFTYVASDGHKHSAPLQFNITVVAPTSPLSISDVFVPVFPGLKVGIPWQQFVSDTDPNATVTLESIGTQPLHGTAQIKDGKLFYSPNKGAVSSDFMTITLQDSDSNTATGLVYLQSARG